MSMAEGRLLPFNSATVQYTAMYIVDIQIYNQKLQFFFRGPCSTDAIVHGGCERPPEHRAAPARQQGRPEPPQPIQRVASSLVLQVGKA